jgi:hypothetical protein
VEFRGSAKMKVDAAVAEATNNELRLRNTELVARVASLEKVAALSVPLDVYREITRNAEHAFRAAAPVNSPAAVIAVATPQTDPLLWSTEAVLDWLKALNWESCELDAFSKNSVTGAMLMHDISSQMCKEWGVSQLHLAQLTRLLRHWKKGWGE